MVKSVDPLTLDELFGTSKRHFWNAVKKIWGFFFGGFGSYLGYQREIAQGNSAWYLLGGFILGMLALYVAIVLLQLIVYGINKVATSIKEAAYGEGFIAISTAFAKAHALRRREEKPMEEFKTILVAFCDEIKKFMDKKTGGNCGVSIKIFKQLPDDDMNSIALGSEVFNLCRNTAHKKRDDDNYKTTVHRISGNTCYQTTLINFLNSNDRKLYFMSNDLPSLDPYINSSMGAKGWTETPEWKNKQYRRDKWPLEYYSELVVALCPGELLNKKELPIIGFICIDSDRSGVEVFNEKYDPHILRGVADGLYDLIKEVLFVERTAKTD